MKANTYLNVGPLLIGAIYLWTLSDLHAAPAGVCSNLGGGGLCAATDPDKSPTLIRVNEYIQNGSSTDLSETIGQFIDAPSRSRVKNLVPQSEVYIRKACIGANEELRVSATPVSSGSHPVIALVLENKSEPFATQTAAAAQVSLSWNAPATGTCVYIIVTESPEHTLASKVQIQVATRMGGVRPGAWKFLEDISYYLMTVPVQLDAPQAGIPEDLQVVPIPQTLRPKRWQNFPILAYTAIGQLITWDRESGPGRLGKWRRPNGLPVGARLLVSRSARAFAESDLKPVFMANNAPPEVRSPLPQVRLSPQSWVRLLVNDYARDGDGDGLGAGLESEIGTCDPANAPWSPAAGKPIGSFFPNYCVSMDRQLWTAADRRNLKPDAQSFGFGANLDVRGIFKDSDHDGIEDGEEVLGVDIRDPRAGAEVFSEMIAFSYFNASPIHKDVLVEMDWAGEEGENPFKRFHFRDLLPDGQAAGLPFRFLFRPAFFSSIRAHYDDFNPEIANNPDGQPGFSIHVDVGAEPTRSFAEWTRENRGNLDWYTSRNNAGQWQADGCSAANSCSGFFGADGQRRPGGEAQCESICSSGDPSFSNLDIFRLDVQLGLEGVYGDWGHGGTWVPGNIIDTDYISTWCNNEAIRTEILKRTAKGCSEIGCIDLNACLAFSTSDEKTHKDVAYRLQFIPEYRKRFFRYARIPPVMDGGGQTVGRYAFGLRGLNHFAFAHELGHTLGLEHHGDPMQPDQNGNPIYISIMNYAYSYAGLAKSFFDLPLNSTVYNLDLNSAGIREDSPWPMGLDIGIVRDAPFHRRIITEQGTDFVDWNGDGVINRNIAVRAPLLISSNLSRELANTEKFQPLLSNAANPGIEALSLDLVHSGEFVYSAWANPSGLVSLRRARLGPLSNGSCLQDADHDDTNDKPCLDWEPKVDVVTGLPEGSLIGVSLAVSNSTLHLAFSKSDCTIQEMSAPIDPRTGDIGAWSRPRRIGAGTCGNQVPLLPELSITHLGNHGGTVLSLFFNSDPKNPTADPSVRQIDGTVRWSILNEASNTWQSRDVIKEDGSSLMGAGNPGASAWPDPDLSRAPAGVVRSAGACIVLAQQNLILRMHCFDTNSGRWIEITALNPATPALGKPSLSFQVLRKADGLPINAAWPARAMIGFMPIPSTIGGDTGLRAPGKFLISRVHSGAAPATDESGSDLFELDPGLNSRELGNSFLSLKWGSEIPLLATYRISSMMSMMNSKTAKYVGLQFNPTADGTPDSDGYHITNDVSIMEAYLCRGIRRDGSMGVESFMPLTPAEPYCPPASLRGLTKFGH